MTFEYKALLIDTSWSAAIGREKIEEQLNELGKDGWDLVPITLEGYLLLKRTTE
jgi:hypothetical protein